MLLLRQLKGYAKKEVNPYHTFNTWVIKVQHYSEQVRTTMSLLQSIHQQTNQDTQTSAKKLTTFEKLIAAFANHVKADNCKNTESR